MTKSFSLLEIIIVVLVISIIASFAIPKLSNYINKTNMTKLKSQISIIRSELANYKSENILLGNENIIDSLDNAQINIKNERLFTKLLDINIISTSNTEKQAGSWLKTSQNSYEFYIDSSTYIKFSLEDEYFICKSSYEVCKDYE
jgi:type II secretory pathway pseudopilin PulG